MKKIIASLLLIISIFVFVGCTELEPLVDNTETECATVTIEKIIEVEKEVPIEIIKEVEKEIIIEKPVEIIKEVEKEVLVEVEKEVLVEVIKEVEIVVPLSDCKIMTWDEVCLLQAGDSISNVFISSDSFVSTLANETLDAGSRRYWSSGVKTPRIETMDPVSLKINYLLYGNSYKIDAISSDYLSYGNIGIISGTIESVIWHTDTYGNKTVEIIFTEKNFQFKNFIDFCSSAL